MYVEIPREIMEEKVALPDVDKIYVIDKFKVSNAKATYKPVNFHLMIEFTDFKAIELSQKSSALFPAYVYNLTPFDKIVPYQGPVANLTYVLGYIRSDSGMTRQ